MVLALVDGEEGSTSQGQKELVMYSVFWILMLGGTIMFGIAYGMNGETRDLVGALFFAGIGALAVYSFMSDRDNVILEIPSRKAGKKAIKETLKNLGLEAEYLREGSRSRPATWTLENGVQILLMGEDDPEIQLKAGKNPPEVLEDLQAALVKELFGGPEEE